MKMKNFKSRFVKRYSTIFSIVVVFCMVFQPGVALGAGYQLFDDFETQLFNSSWVGIETDPNQPVSITTSAAGNKMGWYNFAPHGGGSCLKMALIKGQNYWDNGAQHYKSRFEARSPAISPNGPTSTDTAERWYMFDLCIPPDWDTADDYKDIIVQWHQGAGDVNPAFPALTFSLVANSHFQIEANHITRTNKTLYYEDFITSPLGDLRGKWQSFKVHIKWSKSDEAYGLIEIERTYNGSTTTLATYTGINTIDTGTAWNYFKVGHYLGVGWSGAATKDKMMYYDNIRIYKP